MTPTNLAIGHKALSASAGTENVCIGLNAGARLTFGSRNTFIGAHASLVTGVMR